MQRLTLRAFPRLSEHRMSFQASFQTFRQYVNRLKERLFEWRNHVRLTATESGTAVVFPPPAAAGPVAIGMVCQGAFIRRCIFLFT